MKTIHFQWQRWISMNPLFGLCMWHYRSKCWCFWIETRVWVGERSEKGLCTWMGEIVIVYNIRFVLVTICSGNMVCQITHAHFWSAAWFATITTNAFYISTNDDGADLSQSPNPFHAIQWNSITAVHNQISLFEFSFASFFRYSTRFFRFPVVFVVAKAIPVTAWRLLETLVNVY